jgi:hypothetical protein
VRSLNAAKPAVKLLSDISGTDKSEIAIKSLLESVHSDVTQGTLELFDDNVDGSALVGQLVITFKGLSKAVAID